MTAERILTRRKGRPRNTEGRKQLCGVYLDEKMKKELQHIADTEKRSLSAQVEYVVTEWLKQQVSQN